MRARKHPWRAGHPTLRALRGGLPLSPLELLALCLAFVAAGTTRLAIDCRRMPTGAACHHPYGQVRPAGDDPPANWGWQPIAGGRGWEAVLRIFNEELRHEGVPDVRRGMGESLVGPAIIVYGTLEQKGRLLLRVVSGEDVSCQGYSEPDHGSDLGAAKPRGVVDGDEVVITGQKVWTSGTHRANPIFVLCGADLDTPKHPGLSYVRYQPDPAEHHRRARPRSPKRACRQRKNK